MKFPNIASFLKSATTNINIASATAPSNGQVLTATSPTTATWQTVAGGSFSWGATATGSSGVGLSLSPTSGATGAYAFNVANSSTAPTNGWIYGVLGNTQSVAHTMQKIDLGTSAQGHVGLNIKAYGASATQTGILVDMNTGTGVGLSIKGGQGAGIKFTEIAGAGFYGTMLTSSNTQFADSISQIFNIDLTSGANTRATRTTDMAVFKSLMAASSGSARAHNFNMFNIERQTNFSGSVSASTSTGSVMKLTNNIIGATNLTDTTSVLTLAQGVTTTGSLITMTCGNTNSAAIDFATNLTTSTAPVGATTYINIKINGVAYRLLAQAVA